MQIGMKTTWWKNLAPYPSCCDSNSNSNANPKFCFFLIILIWFQLGIQPTLCWPLEFTKDQLLQLEGVLKKNYSHTRVIIHNGKWRRPLRERPSNIPSGNWTKLIRHTHIHLEYQTLNPLFWIHVCHCQLNNWIYNRLRNIYSKSSFLLSELIRSSWFRLNFIRSCLMNLSAPIQDFWHL